MAKRNLHDPQPPQASATLLRSALDATADGILVVDREGVVQVSNRKFAQIWGIPSSIVESGDDQALLSFVAEQIEDKDEYQARVCELYEHPDAESADVLKLTDGRIIERFSLPQTMDGEVIGRVWSFRDVTEQRRAEEALRTKSVFLEAQANSSIDGLLVVDASGKKILQNARFNEVWKLPQHIFDSNDDTVQVKYAIARTKDPEGFSNRVKYLYANPEVTDRSEIELIDGTFLDRYSSPVFDADGRYYGRIWTFRDMTERKRNEDALRQSEERLQKLTASMPQIVFMCGENGENVYFNQRWAEYTGLSIEESAGHGWTKAFHPDDQVAGSHTIQNAEGYEVELRLRRFDGVYRWFLLRGLPLRDSADGVERWLGTCTDIHDLKTAEEVLHRSQSELEAHVAQRTEDLTRALTEVEQANRAKGEFLSRMSHELRTPLNAILGFGQILEMDDLDPLQMESVQLILKGGSHLLSLINEVLDIAGIDSGFDEFTMEPVCIDDAIVEACAMVAPLAANRNVTIHIASHDLGRPTSIVEPRRLRQVLMNLLSNGIKYNVEGGKLFVTCLAVDEDRLLVEIRDTGAGIAKDDLPKLFTPFERLSATSTDIEGSGLGLVLAQRLVLAMHGTLSVSSTVGVGSTFTIDLPLSSETGASAGQSAPLPMQGVAPYRGAARGTVLCIEDNVSNLRLIEVILKTKREMNLVSAMMGRPGLEMALENAPDVILLDLNLPDMHGSEVLAELKSHESTRHIPVIVISADATEIQIERLVADGAAAYLTKPVDVQKFLETLDGAVLSSRQSQLNRAA